MDSYCYVPFEDEPGCDRFRVVTIFPGASDQAIQCTLEHVALGKSPDYEALSYVWGNPEDKADIFCNGRRLQVTADLHAALHHIRPLGSEPRRIWADAICINQRDNDERGRQVRRMREIYPKASRVLIWLGEAHDGSDEGLEAAREIAQACRQYAAERGDLKTISFSDGRASRLFGKFRDPSQFTRLEAFYRVIRRTWFTRVWVIQELALAAEATILCGNTVMDWKDLMDAITAQDHLNLHLADHERNAYIFILQKAREEWAQGMKLGLLSVLFRYRIFDSTDPRDKIFGLSSLARGKLADIQALQADYNIGTLQLYCTIAEEILKESRTLHLLSVPRRFVGIGPQHLPSWVPDWTNTRLTACLGLLNYSDINDLGFAATRASKAQIRFDDATSSLAVEGHIVDRIQAVGSVLKVEEVPRTNFREVRIPKCSYVLDNWLRVAEVKQEEPYITGEPIRDAFAQTLVTESTSESIETLRAQLDILESYASIARWLGSFSERKPPDTLVQQAVTAMHTALFHNTTDQLTLYFRIHMSSLADRRVFRTERGYIGLAAALAEAGEEVVVVKGGNVPLVLRPKGEAWTLQGDYYVRGIMQGEAYDGERCELMRIS
ncbi:Uu.00g095840.m01.CDS01 [Anthostomella pinea]|uniref:Uu.00g095840.m01.CDS01 n=1 Tax=Anthostomella pinea TaxID=933095 RepID=A0AAI8VC28_9PEZI|nr:Uu.00g095840.m01.CDS01 [Anthostomella pinea]